MSSSAISINNIRGLGLNDVGQFRVLGSLFGWKNRHTAAKVKVVQYDAANVVAAEWYKVSPKDCQLRFRLKDDKVVRFDGFRDADFDVISKHFEAHTDVRVKRRKLATKGWHWGEYNFEGSDYCFNVDNTLAFKIHMPSVHAVNNRTKNDVSIEFEQDSDDPGYDKSGDSLLEIRFTVPTGKDEEDPITSLRDALLKKTGDHALSSGVICMLSDVRVLVPSARFDISMMHNFMKLHGKSNDFIVSYKTITRVFLLPGPQAGTASLILSLDTPLRKGNTRYPNIIVVFDDKKQEELNLNLDDAELHKLKAIQPAIDRHMSGKQFEVVTRVFKALIAKPVIVPGDFKSSAGLSSFRCSNKALNGHVFPLNKLFIFMPKPMIVIRYDEIVNVEFGRTSGSQTRMFEFKVSIKGGAEYEFSSVDRHEYQPLVEFLQRNNIRIRNISDQNAAADKSFLDEEMPTDESDEEFHAESSESESEDEEEEEEEEEDNEQREGKKSRHKRRPPKDKGHGEKTKGSSKHRRRADEATQSSALPDSTSPSAASSAASSTSGSPAAKR